MSNNVYIPFNVSSLTITRTAEQTIPSGNQTYIFARFRFATNDWHGLNKTAIFKKDGFIPIHVPLIDSICQFPDELLVDVGVIAVSVYAGNRRTVNEIKVEVTQSGYVPGVPPTPPIPSYGYVQTPSSASEAITAIRWKDDKQQGMIGGIWKDIGGAGGGTSPYGIGDGLQVNSNVLSVKAGNGLKFIPGQPGEGGTLAVDTVDDVIKDNTQPITSAAVYTEVGNIEALLQTI